MVELIWQGKYDENGRRAAPLRVELPFQTVETVNESSQQRQKMLDLFSAGRDKEWRNRLIWGDKRYVLPSLLPEFAGKVDLIYIDPPFATGADFSFQAQVGDESFEKEASIIEQKAYRDTWGRGLDGYLQWFYETMALLYELLSETGSLFLHLDYRMIHYTKVIMDDLFGIEQLRNQIIWCYTGPGSPGMRQFNRKHDVILWYSKSDKWIFNEQSIRIPHHEKTRENFKQGLEGSGFIADNYELDTKGKIPEDWWEMAIAGRYPVDGVKRTGYPTEKPFPLIERIILTASNENDLVLDCFCGSGTTAAVAEKLNRRWITCDLGRFAIHTARKRLLSIEGVKPFIVQNLGKYERQVWQQAEFGTNTESLLRNYRRFILDLYHAEPIEGYVWLHGKKGGRMVHVGSVDSPVAPGDVRNMAIELQRLVGKSEVSTRGIDVLGWDFALDMNETMKQIAQEAGIDVKFIRMPREILEKKAVEQGDIRFFELAALSADVKTNKRDVIITLTDFMVAPDDVPQAVIQAVKHWSEWIDYWAVDFNFRDDTFHNEWQSYRTRKDRSLQLTVTHPYQAPGTYTVLIKVIDILGNDTTKGVQVTIV